MPGTFGTTTRNLLRYLTGSSKVSDIDEGFQRLAEDVDTKMASYSQDTFAKRPAAGRPNALFKATDTGVLYHDTGSEWEAVRVGPNPAHFATSGPASNIITTASLPTPANTLVRYTARVSGVASGGTDGFVTVKLRRDGTEVASIVYNVTQNGHAEGGNVTVTLDFLQTTAGSHIWKLEAIWGGTGFTGAINPGTLSLLA